ncbi:hypothetical protein DRO59_07770 [Candidatus Bathyarchaeota archaeon]|nr:MAG: hypothetical protein DRO59_07770 [Candidatus Bathyarchaeota archaeon]
MTEGYRLRKIETAKDLKELGYDWWLELCDFEDLKGKYVIDDRRTTAYEPNGTKLVKVALNVDKWVFIEEAEADIVGDELYIAEEEIDRIY